MRWMLCSLIFLTACSGGANHLGNPLLLPVHGAATALSNSAYNARRNKVLAYLAENEPALRAEAKGQPGSAFATLAQLARIPPHNLPKVHRDISELAQLPSPDWVEHVTVISMVYSN